MKTTKDTVMPMGVAMRADDAAPTTVSDGKALGQNPLVDDQILEGFYRPRRGGATGQPTQGTKTDAKGKPTHYKIVCISLYTEDIAHLEELVSELKRRGHSKANKSQVIRAALDQIDLAKIPKSY